MIPARTAAVPRSTAQHVARGDGHAKNTGRRTGLDHALQLQLGQAGVELTWSPSALFLTATGTLVAIGALVGGFLGASLAIVMVGALTTTGVRYVRTKTRERSLAALPELTLRLSRGVRSGQPIDGAIRTVSSEMSPLPPGFLAMAKQVGRGRPLSDALDEWGRTAMSSAERLLVASVLIGVKHGGDLARTLDMVGEGVRDDLELAARRRVLLMNTTMSALVLVSLPIAFSATASLVRGKAMYDGTLGLLLLAGGLTLDLLGLLWMRASMRRLR